MLARQGQQFRDDRKGRFLVLRRIDYRLVLFDRVAENRPSGLFHKLILVAPSQIDALFTDDDAAFPFTEEHPVLPTAQFLQGGFAEKIHAKDF